MAGTFQKLRWNLPWLARYPFERVGAFLERTAFENKHLIITVANHFEPGWSPNGILDHEMQIERLNQYRKFARSAADALIDSDGVGFAHTNFYPAEQYHPEILEIMAEMQADGLGEVEVHLHHGVEEPDTSENLRRTLIDFRDTLAEKHKCLSRMSDDPTPRYAFVHGNLALANSCGGRLCGVDDEMKILQETGCYADMTLPSAPDQSQVAVTNQIYECGKPLDQRAPHSSGRRLRVGSAEPILPVMVTGPLVFNWTRTVKGVPFPRIDDGALAANQGLDAARFGRWSSANITVAGRPDWIFIKLYCHGFFDSDQPYCIGDEAKRFFGKVLDDASNEGTKVHFASAREAFNMVMAAVDGGSGDPGKYRDHRLRPIMFEGER